MQAVVLTYAASLCILSQAAIRPGPRQRKTQMSVRMVKGYCRPWQIFAGYKRICLCVCGCMCVMHREKSVCVCLSFCDYACVTAWLILLLNSKTHPHTHVSYFPFLLIFFKSFFNLLSLLLGHILINSFYSPVHPSLLPSDSLFSLKCYFNNFFALCSVASLFQSQPVSYCNLCAVSSEAFFHISHSDLTGQYYDKRSITGRGHPCVCVYMRIMCVCVCVCVWLTVKFARVIVLWHWSVFPLKQLKISPAAWCAFMSERDTQLNVICVV